MKTVSLIMKIKEVSDDVTTPMKEKKFTLRKSTA